MLRESSHLAKLLPDLDQVVPLAVGGQKEVFRARHRLYGDVVIKLLLDESGRDRFSREIEIAQTAGITGMPRLYEHGCLAIANNPVRYVIEEYIEGVSLRQVLIKNGTISVEVAMGLLESLLLTTVQMEEKHLVHRDIKPENIIVKNSGGFSLLDFGIARHLDKPSLTNTDAYFGPHTPGYSAPEQFRNLKGEIDIRADLFSIGVVVYESLSGRNPFIRGTSHPLEVLRRTETLTPREFDIPGDTQKQLIGFLSVLMQRFPSRRPRNAKTALEWFMALRPTVLF